MAEDWQSQPAAGFCFADEEWDLTCWVMTIAKLRTDLASALARAEAAERVVAAGDRLCVAAIRCGLHTWANIPAEARHRAVEFGCRMHEYFNASPTCEWPMDDTAIRDAKSPLLDPLKPVEPLDKVEG